MGIFLAGVMTLWYYVGAHQTNLKEIPPLKSKLADAALNRPLYRGSAMSAPATEKEIVALRKLCNTVTEVLGQELGDGYAECRGDSMENAAQACIDKLDSGIFEVYRSML